MAKDLESLSKKELIDLAKKKSVKMPYLYRRDELIKLIKKADNPQGPRFVKPRGRAANRLNERQRLALRNRSKAASAKPYYEPTYHQENVQPTYHPAAAVAVEKQEPRTDLPCSYNHTKIALMVRDPFWAFTYWDMGEQTTQKVNALMKEHYGNIRPILRVYDVTDVEFNGKNAHRSFDLNIFLEARNWYINLGVPDRAYLVDLGLLDAQGNFYLIARSNVVRAPRDMPSDVIDEEWMAVDFEEIYALSGGFGIGLSSQELRQRKKKLFEQLLAAPGSGFFSGAISSPAGRVSQEKGKDFFLQVATELIVYGRTMPDAKVTVSGEPIRLRPDGTFSLRYFLPDGEKHLPIQAVSRDEDDSRRVSIRVNKNTTAE
jgi:hypothetical protein